MVAVRQRWDVPRVGAGFQQRIVKVPLEEKVETLMVAYGCYTSQSVPDLPLVTLVGFAVMGKNEMDGMGTGRKTVSSVITACLGLLLTHQTFDLQSKAALLFILIRAILEPQYGSNASDLTWIERDQMASRQMVLF